MPRHWKYDLFIDGKWTTGEASSAIEVIDPATEEVIGQVAEATRADAVRAIQAARKAFDEGPWPWMKPRERAAVLVKMAESLERRAAELRELVVAQTGSVGHITDAFQAGGATGMFRSNAEQIVHSVDWVEANPPTGTSTGIAGSAIIREPVGVVAAITPFNFPVHAERGEDGTGARGRMHGRAEAAPLDAARRVPDRSGRGGGGLAGRRAERHSGRRRGRRGALRQPARRHGDVHRIHRDGPPDHGERRRDGEEASARARRQERADRARRRSRGRRREASASAACSRIAARAVRCRRASCSP